MNEKPESNEELEVRPFARLTARVIHPEEIDRLGIEAGTVRGYLTDTIEK